MRLQSIWRFATHQTRNLKRTKSIAGLTMKAPRSHENRARTVLLFVLISVGGAFAACTTPETGSAGERVHPRTDFPTTGYGYGNATHLLFSYDGPPELKTEWRRISERGIADDPRVQEFINEFRIVLEKHGFIRESSLWREERALSYLAEPMYRGGIRIADAEETTRIRNGKPQKYYQWRGSDGHFTAGAFPDELGTSRWQFESSLRAVYGRPDTDEGYTDFLQLYVAGSREAFYATDPRTYRNSQQFKYGVMGIVAQAGAPRPQALVQHVIIEISTQPNFPASLIDELVVEALNESLDDDEVIQLYPHAALNDFGDTDERVKYFADNITRSVMIEEVQRRK